MIAQILSAVGPVIITSGLGYGWVRLGRRIDSAVVTPLVSTVGTPTLVFSILVGTHLPPEALLAVGGATVAAVIGFLLVGAIILRLAGLSIKTYLPALAFPNTGNLGLPLALYAFGQEGLGYAVVFFSVTCIVNFTIGQAVAAGRTNWAAALKNPVAVSSMLGIAAAFVGVTLPEWVMNTLSLIAGMTIPLMLLMLGASLAQIRVAALPRSFAVSMIRIVMGAMVGTLVALLFGLTGPARAVLILQSAMPVAVYNYLFALMWNNQPEEIAGLVVVSTLVSVLTIPVLLAVLLP
jgi:predicted permease